MVVTFAYPIGESSLFPRTVTF